MKPFLIGVALFLFLASPLHAHAVLIAATPAVNAHVNGPSIAIRLQFNSRVDGRRSLVRIVLPNRTFRSLGITPQSASDALTSKVDGLEAGDYTLQWQVLSADGHITRGEFPFHVK